MTGFGVTPKKLWLLGGSGSKEAEGLYFEGPRAWLWRGFGSGEAEGLDLERAWL